jgi:DNA-binding GntR family transcriptional regulator
MKVQLDRLRRLSSEVEMVLRTLLDEHRAIVDALEAGDVRAGVAHIRRHSRRVLEYGPVLRARHPDYFTA